MSFEIIIQEIKALGYILPIDEENGPEAQCNLDEKRKFRITFGKNTFVSKQYAFFRSRTELSFYEPYRFFYDNHSRILNIQIFKEHQYLDNSDIQHQLNGEVDLSDFSIIKGDYIETQLTDLYGQSIGKLILLVDVFQKGPKFHEKVVSEIFIQKVKQEADRAERQLKVSQASKNIKHLLVNNQLAGTLMTINSMHVMISKQDPTIFNKDCFILVKYGQSIKVFSKIVRSTNKESVSFMDYLQFMKNQGQKFEFFFLFFDEVGVIECKAKGQIKYIIFDETINCHSIILLDKKLNKYGVLMVKFIEKEEEKINLKFKIEKRLKQKENQINEAIDNFNRHRFELKYQNHVLSEKMFELEMQKLEEEEEKARPLNPEEKKEQEQHKKFIEFLQKQVVRIQREIVKREEKNRQNERKQRYLPIVHNKSPQNGSRNRSLLNCQSSTEFRENKVKFPKV